MADAQSPTTPGKKIDPAIKWGSIFIIVLMLLSGAAVYFGSQSATNSEADPNQPAPGVDTYIADDVQATVTEVFHTAIVGGQTAQSDKLAIDEALLAIPGVNNLNSQFTQLSSTDSTLTYVANVTLAETVDSDSFVNAVDATQIFSAPEIYFQAAVEVPSTLNAVKNGQGAPVPVTLPQTTIQGIVNPTTRAGDTISGRISAGFQGPQFTNAFMIETQNLSASPEPLSFSETHALVELEKSLTLAGSLEYYPALSPDSLAEGISHVSGVVSVSNPLIPQLNNMLNLTLDDANAVAEDVNALMAAHPDEFQGVSLSGNTFTFTLKNITLAHAKQLIAGAVTESLQVNADLEFNSPISQFLVDVNTSSMDTVSLAHALGQYFTALDANANVEIFQNGWIDLPALVTDANKMFPIENGQLRVAVLPGHAVGDAVPIFINAIAIRDELVYVNGVENTAPDANAAA